MFSTAKTNPFDDIVAKTTDENLTSENWELIINLCDKVDDEGEQGARNVIAALLKRLAHRNSNVQIYALALADSLSKNCKGQTGLNRELASKSFTQGLERLITDRNTHDKVKKKALSLIAMWAREFNDDANLMTELYNDLRAKNYKFDEESEPPPPRVDDDTLRREEEELQAVLEMSKHDKGGRGQWDSYNTRAAGEGSSSSSSGPSRSASKPAEAAHSAQKPSYTQYAGGYVPARTPSPRLESPVTAAPVRTQTYSSPTPAPAAQLYQETSSQAQHGSQSSLPLKTASRVRALYPFEGNEKGELSFLKGDIIKVVDQNYTEWWRGQLKGRTGIFPVNYVELLPEPTSEEIAREAEHEAAVFAQAANVDKLLSMLRGLDPAKDNLADNEEIQELYHASMSLRPRVVKLIDKYSQKRTELVSIHETFVKARNIYDRMMEESLARNSGIYDPRPTFQTQLQPQLRPESRARQEYGASPYPIYEQQPATPFTGVFPQPNSPNYPAGVSPNPQQFSQPAYGPQQYPGQQVYTVPSHGTPEQIAYGGYPHQQAGIHVQAPPQQQVTASPLQQTQQQTQQVPAHPQPTPGPAQAAPSLQVVHQPLQSQPLTQVKPQQQPLRQSSQHEQASATPQAQPQRNPQPSVISGPPPYPFDPNARYSDENAQAWASYYAQGGDDPQGLVYFISVPRLKEQQSEEQTPSTQPAVEVRSSSFESGGGGAASAAQLSGQQAVQALQLNQQLQPLQISEGIPSSDAGSTVPSGTGTLAQLPASPLAMNHQQQPIYYAAQAAPTSPTGAAQQQHFPPQGQYPPNPYPDAAANSGSPDSNTQLAQIQGQFGSMSVGSPAPQTQTV